jgi:hypothetical protein
MALLTNGAKARIGTAGTKSIFAALSEGAAVSTSTTSDWQVLFETDGRK